MIRIVFFSFLWVFVCPLSIWADGKGAEASEKVGPPSEVEETAKVIQSGKSEADSSPPKQTEQPTESVKKVDLSSGVEETANVIESGKSDPDPAQPKQTEPATVSGKNESKANETGETAKLTEALKSEAKSGSLKQTELAAKSGKKDSESGQPEKGLLSVGKKSESDLLQSKGEEATSEKRDSLGAKEGTKLKVSDTKSVSKEKEITTKVGKGKKDSVVPIIRTLEAIAEKDGGYLFAGKILADGGSAVLAAGIELSPDMKFKKTTKLAFSLQDGESSYRVKTKNLGAGTRVFYRAYVRNSEESNLGSVKKLKTTALLEKEGWWKKGEDLGAGWRKSKWFGAFRKQAELNWVYHEKLGWAYVVSDQRDGLWLWQGENGWTWTQEGAWPCLWSNQSGSWLCFLGKLEGKPIFYDYQARRIRNLPQKAQKNEKNKVATETTTTSKAAGKALVDSVLDGGKAIVREKAEETPKSAEPVVPRKDVVKEALTGSAKADDLSKTDSAKIISEETAKSGGSTPTSSAKKVGAESGKTVDLSKSQPAKKSKEETDPVRKLAEESDKVDPLPKTDSSPKKMEEIIETEPSKEKPATTNGLPDTDPDKKLAEETAKSDGLPKTDSEKIPAEAPKPTLK